MKSKEQLFKELIEVLQKQKDLAVSNGEYYKASKLRDEHKQLVKEFAESLNFKIYFLPELPFQKVKDGTIVDGVYIPDNDL